MSVLEDTWRKATCTVFTSELGEPMTVPVVTAAVPMIENILANLFLVIYNALYFQNTETNLSPL